jgi:hypothetical protein
MSAHVPANQIPAHARVWITVPAAAALSGLSVYVIRGHIKRGSLDSYTPSPRGTKIALDTLAQYLPPDIKALLPDSLIGDNARAIIAQRLATLMAAGQGNAQ